MTSSADIHSLTFGTGHSIFTSTLLPALESVSHEILIVTCFWAASDTRDDLSKALIRLSNKALQRQTHEQHNQSRNPHNKVTVRINFSSSSLTQKLFHPQSEAGKTYSPSEWPSKLGLPSREDLPGLDVQIKSKFFLPFSVWHPKFIVIDRKRVFLPSCNVSWEDWFEGCVELSGPIVHDFVRFWGKYWGGYSDDDLASITAGLDGEVEGGELENVPCKFLPSPHHRNPNFRLPWQTYAPSPATPLNSQLLELFAHAQKDIYMQTPNVTSPPVLDAIKQALARGTNITILTSEKLMILEQLVTAGTTTSRCVQSLIEYHKQLLMKPKDEEAGLLTPGKLSISYYVPLSGSISGPSGGAEPVQSHLKLTIFDSNAIVFGSGNMDRASWYTSQELGVAFFSEDLVAKTLQNLHAAVDKRRKVVYNSGSP